MKLILLVLLAGALITAPFALLRRPWALRWWRRGRLILIIYALVVLLSAILGLALRWDAIYG